MFLLALVSERRRTRLKNSLVLRLRTSRFQRRARKSGAGCRGHRGRPLHVRFALSIGHVQNRNDGQNERDEPTNPRFAGIPGRRAIITSLTIQAGLA